VSIPTNEAASSGQHFGVRRLDAAFFLFLARSLVSSGSLFADVTMSP